VTKLMRPSARAVSLLTSNKISQYFENTVLMACTHKATPFALSVFALKNDVLLHTALIHFRALKRHESADLRRFIAR